MYPTRLTGPSPKLGAILAVLLMGLAVFGCSKEPVDPIEAVKALIPKIQDGLNKKDIAGLKAMGDSQFEANRFITDVFAHGVEGDVTLTLVRIRHVTDEVSLQCNATFGSRGNGGLKELRINFSGGEEDGDWKMGTYTLVDRSLPAPKGAMPDSAKPAADSTNPS